MSCQEGKKGGVEEERAFLAGGTAQANVWRWNHMWHVHGMAASPVCQGRPRVDEGE